MALLSALWVIFFWGGWCFPILEIFLPGEYLFGFKTTLLASLFIIVRAILPRYRYDQLMYLGWKTLLPLTLGLLVFYSSILLGFDLLPIKEIPLFKY